MCVWFVCADQWIVCSASGTCNNEIGRYCHPVEVMDAQTYLCYFVAELPKIT